MSANYSIYSIPIYWFVALYPHAYAVGVMKKANNNRWNNANPRGTSTNASYEKSVPADVYARFERAEAAHKNAMENAPFFVGAVLAGNYAGLSAGTMNAVSAGYVGLRILHSVLYVNTTTQKRSFLRTMAWVVSTALLFGVYVAAGNEVKGK